MASSGTTSPRPVHRRLERETDGTLVAGVAAGLARHLALDVVVVRAAFVLLTIVHGAGLLLYAAFWAVVPQAPSGAAAVPSRWGRRAQLLGLGALAIAAILAVAFVGGWSNVGALPLIVAAVGVGLIWRQADESQRAAWARMSRRLAVRGRPDSAYGVLRIVGGTLLVLAGMAGFLASQNALAAAREGILATLVVVTGLALVTAPVWWRLARDLSAERRERIRSEERAEMAATVHDSVLHTLTLIQRSAHDPVQVQRLARGSERELRSWLYRPAADAGTRFGAAVEAAAAEVEDAHGTSFEVVGVGDARLDERLTALVAAAREAMVNTARYAEVPSASVFYEVEPELATVFVRDRGRGFDPSLVPADRYGIRHSICERMQRHGGAADVRSHPGDGTEVQLSLPMPVGRSAS